MPDAKVNFKFLGTRPDPRATHKSAPVTPVNKNKAAPESGTPISCVIKASSRKAVAARTGKIDPIRLAELQNQTRQKIPTREQVIAQGGGVGGYLRAWRDLNG